MYGRYQAEFTVVGVHTPEFAFEGSVQNVERAVGEQGLEYPVGVDNGFVAWKAYGNRYWPTIYVIDRAGRIRYTHVGEGDYARTEGVVRALLAEAVDPAADGGASLSCWLRVPTAGSATASRTCCFAADTLSGPLSARRHRQGSWRTPAPRRWSP